MSAERVMYVPPLRPGDHLTADDFLRRYEAMPETVKAELINGVVYMPSPVTVDDHGAPHFDFVGWLAIYRAFTPGVQGGDNSTLRLDLGFNVPQADAFLRLLPEYGGQSLTKDRYVVGAPELLAEIAASSASYDLHEKLHAYQRNGVQEYLVWRTEDQAIDWFILKAGKFQRLKLDQDGVYKNKVFPGLWLDAQALLGGDLAAVLKKVQEGVASKEHTRFVQKLKTRRC